MIWIHIFNTNSQYNAIYNIVKSKINDKKPLGQSETILGTWPHFGITVRRPVVDDWREKIQKDEFRRESTVRIVFLPNKIHRHYRMCFRKYVPERWFWLIWQKFNIIWLKIFWSCTLHVCNFALLQKCLRCTLSVFNNIFRDVLKLKAMW